MIRLIFTIQRETFTIDIVDKSIFWTDRKTKRVRLIPRDENINRMVTMSRNKIPPQIVDWFNLNEEEKKEYDNAKDDNELADICVRDTKKKGAILQKREVI
jgi:hypothetical protein